MGAGERVRCERLFLYINVGSRDRLCVQNYLSFSTSLFLIGHQSLLLILVRVYWNRLTLGEFFHLLECVECLHDYVYYVDLVRGCTVV